MYTVVSLYPWFSEAVHVHVNFTYLCFNPKLISVLGVPGSNLIYIFYTTAGRMPFKTKKTRYLKSEKNVKNLFSNTGCSSNSTAWYTMYHVSAAFYVHQRCLVYSRERAHMFEDHEVVDEKDTFALEQLPDRLSSLALGLRQRLNVVLLARR